MSDAVVVRCVRLAYGPLQALALALSAGHMPAACAQTALAIAAAPPGLPVTSRAAQLARSGYTEHEFFVSGQAHYFAPQGPWDRDGRWAIKPDGAPVPFTIRVLVRRPADATRANGTVVLEWINNSLGFDIDGIWGLAHREFTREGTTWVGASVEPRNIDALKDARPARYQALNVPKAALAYDITSQIGTAIRQGKPALLGATPVKHVLAAGYSQSAANIFTYLNAVQPVHKVFDGFFIQGRAPFAAAISSTQLLKYNPTVRADLGVPVFILQAEGEARYGWPLSKVVDTGKVRYWEVAGASHIDRDLAELVEPLAARDHHTKPVACRDPINSLPMYEATNAAWHAMLKWAGQGTPPPTAPRLLRNEWGLVVDDAFGNAMGGLRLPEQEVPLATHHVIMANVSRTWGVLSLFTCFQGGRTEPLDAATLARLYPDAQAYLTRYKAAADKALAAGHLLPADHAESLLRAQRNAQALKH